MLSKFFKFGEGAAILYVLTILCLILAALYLKLFFPTVTGGRRPHVGPATASAARESLAGSLVNKLAAAGTLARTRLERLPDIPQAHSAFGPAAAPPPGSRGARVRRRADLHLVVRPFVWLVVMSLSPSADLVRVPPTVVPDSLTIENYRFVLFPGGVADGQSSVQATRVPYSIFNSLVVATCVTAINLVLGSLAGYAYAPPQERTHEWHAVGADDDPYDAGARADPAVLHRVPHARPDRHPNRACDRLLQSDPAALDLDHARLLRGLPPNLEKAALVDGCTRMQAIRKVIMPVARPGIVAAGIFCFLVSWNEFIFALILTGTPNAQTIPVIIAGFLVQLRFYDYGPMFAASVLADSAGGDRVRLPALSGPRHAVGLAQG